MLSYPKYNDGTQTVMQTKFGGFNRHDSASDGEIYDMLNMTSDSYPVMSTREHRYEIAELYGPVTNERIIASFDVADTPFFLCAIGTSTDDEELTAVALVKDGSGNDMYHMVLFRDNRGFSRQNVSATAYNDRLIVYYDGKMSEVYFDREAKKIVSKRADFSLYWDEGVAIWHNTALTTTYIQIQLSYEGDISVAEQIRQFRVGDVLTVTPNMGDDVDFKILSVSVGTDDYLNDAVQLSTHYIKDIYTTMSPEDDVGVDSLSIVYWSGGVRRRIPSFNRIISNNDRIWGINGNEIYCSASENPYTWYDFDTSTVARSFYAKVPYVGQFTGICSYMGDVFFFTKEEVYRMYGSTPDAFSLRSLGFFGCEEGESCGTAMQALFYNSTRGPALFDGESAKLINRPFGNLVPKNTVGCGCGTKYYLADGEYLYVYDIQNGTWHKEDGAGIVDMIVIGGRLVIAYDDTRVFYYQHDFDRDGVSFEAPIKSCVEFADISEGSPYYITAGEITLRLWLDEGSELSMYISYDGGEYELIHSTTQPGKHSETVRYTPKQRCDHYRLKFEGVGAWKLYSMMRTYQVGSNVKYGG